MVVKKFKKIMVANRGEIAVRVLKTANKMGFKTVSLYSKADADAIHRSQADESYLLGESSLSESYLNIENIIKLAKDSGSEAVHPGYGLLSENENFAKRVVEEGMVFIGPDQKSISMMGNKGMAKREMLKIGIPCIPGYQGIDQNNETIFKEAKGIGFPLLIKASKGGGGRGMRLVKDESEMITSLDIARKEAISSFGCDEIILEKAIFNPRHIEVQILADQYGNCIHLGERDCSIQRRHQKIIEEAPSSFLDEDLRKKIGKAAVEIAKRINYVGVGTVEFLFDEDKKFYFMEMNTRLQVEHTVTEMITGLDLVQKQIEVAQGFPLNLEQESILFNGHSIEARLYTEDPSNDYAPQTGEVVLWREAKSKGIRFDSGLFSGIHITPYYDPMVAKIVSRGKDREEARLNLVNALLDTDLFGVKTNKELLLKILENNKFIEKDITTSFLINFVKEQVGISKSEHFTALCIGACLEYELKRNSFLEKSLMISEELMNWTSSKNLPFFCHYKSREKDWYLSVLPNPFENGIYEVEEVSGINKQKDNGEELNKVKVKIIEQKNSRARIEIENIIHKASFFFNDNEKFSPLYLNFKGKDFCFINLWSKLNIISEKEDDGIILSPMHGILSEILVKSGDVVKKGQIVAIVEAMKMQNELKAKVNGKVKNIHQKKGNQVSIDEKLIDIEVEEYKND